MLKPKLIVILGPTASGKTGLAIRLAKKFGGEVVSADSRQIYREIDIATAKPTQTQSVKRKAQNNYYLVDGIPHYLIDAVKPNQVFNVALYKKLALKAIKNILRRGKTPFLVGGTGLYIKAIIDNLDFPKIAPDKSLRQKLEKKSLKELFRLYQKLDPKGAKIIDKDNKRRLVRALEVCILSKQPFWQQRKQKKPLFEVLQIGIKLPKSVLNKNISVRTDKMIKLGLEREIKTLFKKYGNLLIFSQTIGYQEWLPYMQNRIDFKIKKQIVEQIKNHTRQYAKRQLTWFTRQNFAGQNLGGLKKGPTPVPLSAGRYGAGSRIRWVSSPRLYQKAKKLVKNFLNYK